jgi:hypothetical protein
VADTSLKAAYDRCVEKRTKEASRSEEERDREAIERQKAMRAKLLELSKVQTDDPYRTAAIALMIERLPDRDTADA